MARPATVLYRMPIAVTHDKRQRRLDARATGVLTLDEILSFIRTARAPVEYRDCPLLFDARGATIHESAENVEPVIHEIQSAAAREHGVRSHVAVVADDDALFRFCLAYEARLIAAGLPVVRVFRERTDAEQWLTTMANTRRFQAG
jgi:hypothetical protein